MSNAQQRAQNEINHIRGTMEYRRLRANKSNPGRLQYLEQQIAELQKIADSGAVAPRSAGQASPSPQTSQPAAKKAAPKSVPTRALTRMEKRRAAKKAASSASSSSSEDSAGSLKVTPKVTPKATPKKVAPKATPKAVPKKEEPKKVAPKAVPKKEEPKKVAPKATPKKEEPKKVAPKAEPKKEEPKLTESAFLEQESMDNIVHDDLEDDFGEGSEDVDDVEELKDIEGDLPEGRDRPRSLQALEAELDDLEDDLE